MIIVTLDGPRASGKTRTIRHAMEALKARGLKCLDDECLRSTKAGRNRNDVVFETKISGSSLNFSITGTGPIDNVRNAVSAALAKVRTENNKFRMVR